MYNIGERMNMGKREMWAGKAFLYLAVIWN